MRALVLDRCAHPAIRTLATSIAGFGLDAPAKVRAIRQWLRSHIRFLADPDTTELLHDPVLLVRWINEQGMIGVDCDDVAILGAALGKAVGLPARFVIVGFFDERAPFTHVWAELFDGADWRELDTTRTQQGIEDERIRRRVAVDVATGQQQSLGGRMSTLAVSPYQRRIGVFPNRPRPALGVAIAPIIAAAPSFIQAMGPLLGGSKEPERIAANQKAETLAIAGNAAALEFLRCRSVQGVVCGNLPGYGDIGGWATQTARDDAGRRYNNALAALAQGSGGVPGGGGGVVVTGPGGARVGVSNTTLLLGAAAAFLLLPKLLK